MRICSGNIAALYVDANVEPVPATCTARRARRLERARLTMPRLLVRGRLHLHEGGELDLRVRHRLRPDRHLLAVLPLEVDAGDITFTVLQRMRELIVLAVELPASDRADIVGLFKCIDHLVGIGRALIAM